MIDAREIPENLDLEFWELLSDIYALKRDHALALGALQQAINLTKTRDLIRRARLERKVGVLMREQRLYGEELKACQLAEHTLGVQPIGDALGNGCEFISFDADWRQLLLNLKGSHLKDQDDILPHHDCITRS